MSSVFSRGRPVLCLVTDRRRLSGDEDCQARVDAMVRQVADAASAGIDLVQLRERDLDDRTLYDVARRSVEVSRGTSTAVLVNDRFDIAVLAAAAGVHLRADSVDPSELDGVVPPGFLIGRSVHSAVEAEKVVAAGPLDYLIFGTVFESRSKPNLRPAGLGELAQTVQAVDIPVLAIGGITPERVVAVARTGAAGVAGIGCFLPRTPSELGEIVSRIRRLFDTS